MNRKFAIFRKSPQCDSHTWKTSVISGLRRDLCEACGAVSMQSVDSTHELSPTLAAREVISFQAE